LANSKETGKSSGSEKKTSKQADKNSFHDRWKVHKTNTALSKKHTSEIRYRRLFESAKDGILILDAYNGKIIDVNPFLINLLDYSKEELLGKELWEIGVFRNIIASKDSFIELQEKEYIRYEDMPMETKNGKLVEVEFVSNVYLEDKNKVIQCNIRDITERKKAEKELIIVKAKAEESDHLKTVFLHNISHEIRTPMNAIVGFAGFLKDTNLSFEKRYEFVDIIIQSSHQLLSIINDLVNISSIEAGQEKVNELEINLNSTLNCIYSQFDIKALKQKLSFSHTNGLPDNEAWIITDETKLDQIISNILVNAFKFTNFGSIEIGYQLIDSNLEFYIKDTGIGIPIEMQTEIFKRFRQVEFSGILHPGGSGLGLSISKAYVEMLGGKIWLSSEPEKGSVFYFTIPYKPSKQPDSNIAKLVTNFDKEGGKTLLIAEDDDLSFLLMCEILTPANFKIIRALNGIEAIEKCESNPNIEMVLMDIKMPLMNGYDATRGILAIRPNLPVIAQTAYGTETDKTNAFSSGCCDIITKPLDSQELLFVINEHLIK